MRCSRVGRAIMAAVSEMATCGVSARKVAKVASALGIDGMSASQVSRIRRSPGEVVGDLRTRVLPDVTFPHIWLDATYMGRGDSGHASPCALVTAMGAGSDGRGRVLRTDAFDAETCAGWQTCAGWPGFPPSPRGRGVSGVPCVVPDAHEGLRKAMGGAFPGAARRRRAAHPMRNAASCAPTGRRRAAVPSILRAAFAGRDPELVREPYHLATGEVGRVCPKAAGLPEEAGPDALAYLDFPYEHHRRLRADNARERCNRGLKRRSRVVRASPSRRSLIRMPGAVFSGVDEGWRARRWLADGSIALAVESAGVRPPAPNYSGTAQGHARRTMELVMAGNQIGKRAA